jgi:hypothetical protein
VVLTFKLLLLLCPVPDDAAVTAETGPLPGKRLSSDLTADVSKVLLHVERY